MVKPDNFKPDWTKNYSSKYYYINMPYKYTDPCERAAYEALDAIVDGEFGKTNGVFDILLERFSELHDLPENTLFIGPDHPLRKEWIKFVEDQFDTDDQITDYVFEFSDQFIEEPTEENW